MLETKVTAVEAKEDGIYVTMEGKKAPAEPQRYDAVLVAIGRVPNGKNLDAGKAPIFAFRPTRTIMQTCAYEYWVLSTDGKNPILCVQTQIMSPDRAGVCP